uniref:GPI transamidase component putative n=1 Tax=Albugo laibachii Nc14 TaxID=890382 RepID=F0WXT5_9STRA|nr:GPI transamidase component putative [Albugo laibachii Nc14]|eukprot:CCA26283.1 GPI transamidase component putative [Albugo laibachii Nc14]
MCGEDVGRYEGIQRERESLRRFVEVKIKPNLGCFNLESLSLSSGSEKGFRLHVEWFPSSVLNSGKPVGMRWVLWAGCISFATARYIETLTIRPIPKTQCIVSSFLSRNSEQSNKIYVTNYPTIIQQILRKYELLSFRLSFSIGQYSQVEFGAETSTACRMMFNGSECFIPEQLHAPFGATLEVEFYNDGHQSDSMLEKRWKGLTAELGGLFSASLNQMNEMAVAIIDTRFDMDNQTNADSGIIKLKASLPREEICTENLTPWIKLLPCRSNSGLGSLIDPIQIFTREEYLALSVSASRKRENGSTKWDLWHQMTFVQRKEMSASASISLNTLYLSESDKRERMTACPLADKSSIFLDIVSHQKNGLVATPAHAFDEHFEESISLYETKLRSESNDELKSFSLKEPWIHFKAANSSNLILMEAQMVTAHRFVSGFGQVRGGLAVQIENKCQTCSIRIRYHDVIPWYLRLYFGTFQYKSVSRSIQNPSDSAEVFKYEFEPAHVRGRPHQLLIEAVLPPSTALIFSIQFEKAFLRLSEHPPDANRGFDIPAATVFVNLAQIDVQYQPLDTNATEALRFPRIIYTEPLLVALPTPDFSMPYNVITLTSTAIAFFIGTMLNTLLRKPPRYKTLLSRRQSGMKFWKKKKIE